MLDKTKHFNLDLDELFDVSSAAPKKVKLPNFDYPTIIPVRADLFDIDLSDHRQRDPELRKRKLIAQFGENGEKFNFDNFEVITALPRDNGRFFPSGGMGRIWAVINLVKRPDLEVPTLVKKQAGDQKEKLSFVQTQTGVSPIKAAQLFMTYGSLEGKAYEVHRAIVRELNRLGLTTVPGAGPNSITYTAAVFAGRLGKLEGAYNLARDWWFTDKLKAGAYRYKVEGTALAAIAAMLYSYDEHIIDLKHMAKRVKDLNYKEFKSDATTQYGNGTTHQGRDDAPALLHAMIDRYNSRRPKNLKSLAFSETMHIRADFKENAPLFREMHDAWRMLVPKKKKIGV